MRKSQEKSFILQNEISIGFSMLSFKKPCLFSGLEPS